MSLNRNMFWTTKHGQMVRVREMTIMEVATALLYIEEMQFDYSLDDPYLVESICKCSDTCPIRTEPSYIKDGFSLDHWYTFFNRELDMRAARIEKALFDPKKRPEKPSIGRRLVNALKFW